MKIVHILTAIVAGILVVFTIYEYLFGSSLSGIKLFIAYLMGIGALLILGLIAVAIRTPKPSEAPLQKTSRRGTWVLVLLLLCAILFFFLGSY